jgi:hypothetical protein
VLGLLGRQLDAPVQFGRGRFDFGDDGSGLGDLDLRAGYTLLQFRCPAPCAGGYSPDAPCYEPLVPDDPSP